MDRCEYDKPCFNGTCVSTPTDISPIAYTCNCAPGFTGMSGFFDFEIKRIWFAGPTCANETNECIPDQCQHQATCVDQYLSYQCMCIPGSNYLTFDSATNDFEALRDKTARTLFPIASKLQSTVNLSRIPAFRRTTKPNVSNSLGHTNATAVHNGWGTNVI